MKKVTLNILFRIVMLLLPFTLTSCYEEFLYRIEIDGNEALLFINKHEVFFDTNEKTALVSISEFGYTNTELSFNQFAEIRINDKAVRNNEKFDFGFIDKNSTFTIGLPNNDNKYINYTLNFTLLPIIQITHKYFEIPDEPKGIGLFNLSDPASESSIIEYCGIEQRGGSASGHPKKSYGFEIRENDETRVKKNMVLLGMYNTNNWILDATYTDMANTRNRVSFEIWNDIQLYNPKKNRTILKSSIAGKYIELFINDEYQGIYCFNEGIDEHILINNEHKYATGFLYKSENWAPATLYSNVPDTTKLLKTWSGWVQKYPDPEENSYWKPLFDFVDMVVNSSNIDFTDSIATMLDFDQAIDYYILLNLIQGADNAGKNIFMAKKAANLPFFICPWDMDATWGRDWQGVKISAQNNVSFKLYDRLMTNNPNNFKQKLKDRWDELKTEIITTETIQYKFDHYYQLLIKSGAAKREMVKWPKSMPDLDAEHHYIQQYIDERIVYLDTYFHHL